jgi:hypothetical protein
LSHTFSPKSRFLKEGFRRILTEYYDFLAFYCRDSLPFPTSHEFIAVRLVLKEAIYNWGYSSVAEHMLPGFNPQHRKLKSYEVAPNAIDLLDVLLDCWFSCGQTRASHMLSKCFSYELTPSPEM